MAEKDHSGSIPAPSSEEPLVGTPGLPAAKRIKAFSGSLAGHGSSTEPLTIPIFNKAFPFGGEPEPGDAKVLSHLGLYEKGAPVYTYVNTTAAALFSRVQARHSLVLSLHKGYHRL